ncbi:MAG: hypothetical protein V1748_08110 [Actinomycetota bacterium]
MKRAMMQADWHEEYSNHQTQDTAKVLPSVEESRPDGLNRVPTVLLIIGLSMLALYLLQTIAGIIQWLDIASESHGAMADTGWLLLEAIVFSDYYLFAIIGATLVLIAIRVANRPKWARYVAVIKVFAALIIALVLTGLIGMINSDFRRVAAPTFSYVVYRIPISLVAVTAFSAIFIIETPELRRRLGDWFRRLLHKQEASEAEIPEED